MSRLKKLIKEALTIPPKKNCDCGGACCSTKSTALVLKESKFVHIPISDGLKHHIDNNKPLINTSHIKGSQEYFDLFVEARTLYSRGFIEVNNEDDKAILTETNLGHFGIFEGKKVPLDYPIKENISDQEYFSYLNDLRDSGQTNMFGAGEYLERDFNLDKREAREILARWMRSFNENIDEEKIGNKINKARAKAHFKLGEKIAVVHKVTKNVMPIEDIRQIDTFDTNKYDFAYLVEGKLNESYMSDIDIIRQSSSSLGQFMKEFFKHYGHKVAKSTKSVKWLKSIWNAGVNEGKLNEDRFGHPITARTNQMYIQISKLIDMLSGEEKRDVQNAFKVFMDIVGPAKEEEEQKSKFKKTGERSGFDMRGINEEGESWGLDTRRLADSFTFDELEQLYNDKKISKEDLNGAKSYLQSWIDQHPTYLPQRDLTSSNRQKIRDKYLNEEEWSEDFGELEEINLS